jgi:hypothetical protein
MNAAGDRWLEFARQDLQAGWTIDNHATQLATSSRLDMRHPHSVGWLGNGRWFSKRRFS